MDRTDDSGLHRAIRRHSGKILAAVLTVAGTGAGYAAKSIREAAIQEEQLRNVAEKLQHVNINAAAIVDNRRSIGTNTKDIAVLQTDVTYIRDGIDDIKRAMAVNRKIGELNITGENHRRRRVE